MRKAFILILLALCFKGFCQVEVEMNGSTNTDPELPLGSIMGQVTTTDNKPGSYVTVILKRTNKFAITNENGGFTIKNVKEGSYTLEISMVGLKLLPDPTEEAVHRV